MENITIVFDFYSVAFLKNNIFQKEVAQKYPGALWLVDFFTEAKKRQWNVITSDVFLEEPAKYPHAFLVSEMITPQTKKIFRYPIILFITICAESPNVAWDFYHNLPENVKSFHHVFLFGGVREKFAHSFTMFHQLYWNNSLKSVRAYRKWNDKKFIVMVASNKNQFRIHEGNFYLLKKITKILYVTWLRSIDPLFRFQDLYQLRIEAIKYFSGNSSFSLFGTLWDQRHGLTRKEWNKINLLNARPIEDKIALLNEYKFSICFENCVFPGYITEKIFDCFFAGCIPIYYGAPDITDYIPAATFVDFRCFKDFAHLKQHLLSMTETQAQEYLYAAQQFLVSANYEKFTDVFIVREVLNLVDDEVARKKMNELR